MEYLEVAIETIKGVLEKLKEFINYLTDYYNNFTKTDE